ncbi:MAG: hypothetical protein ACKPGB_21205, partial [Dolichospermum sp.]
TLEGEVNPKSKIVNPKSTDPSSSAFIRVYPRSILYPNPRRFSRIIASNLALSAEVLNVKILRIVSKLCIGIGDTKFDQLMTLFSIDNGFYLGKTQRL